MKINFLYIFAFIFLSSFLGCTKAQVAPEIDPNRKGTFILNFDAFAGSQDFQLGQNYTNAAGEQFNLDLLQYYISNIRLKNEDGTEYVVPQDESYFLVREHQKDSQLISLSVPEGNYQSVTFTIGVDSLRNTMDISKRAGVLDIGSEQGAKGMYWSWNSGYIFVKAEGVSPQVAVGNNGQRRFRYHIGGFGGYSSRTINNIKNRTLDFGRDRAKVREKQESEVHIIVDVLKMFAGNKTISLAANPTVMFSPFSVNVAANYVNMFEYDHIHNGKGHK